MVHYFENFIIYAYMKCNTEYVKFQLIEYFQNKINVIIENTNEQ